MKRPTFIVLLCLALAGCATGPAKVWWNPLTWGTDRAASVERIEKKQDVNNDALVKQAQVENAKTIEALRAAPPSRPVEVASRTADNAQALLDKAAGSLSLADVTELRATIKSLVSENTEIRAAGEKRQARDEATAAKLTEENDRLRALRKDADEKLAAGYERERALANQVRNFWFVVGGLVLLYVLGNLLSLAARFNPGLAGVARIVNGVAAPALAFAEARASDGLQKVGHAIQAVREQLPAVAEQVVQVFDGPLDADHKTVIAAAAKTAPR